MECGCAEPQVCTCPHVYGGVKLSIVSRMIAVDHLEKVGIVARTKRLVQGTVEGLAREGSHGEYRCFVTRVGCVNVMKVGKRTFLLIYTAQATSEDEC